MQFRRVKCNYKWIKMSPCSIAVCKMQKFWTSGYVNERFGYFSAVFGRRGGAAVSAVASGREGSTLNDPQV